LAEADLPVICVETRLSFDHLVGERVVRIAVRSIMVPCSTIARATLVSVYMANQRDLDEAYHAAAKAQVSWAARLPAERAAVMLRSAAIMEARQSEIVDWLVRESGSTRLKAELEWQFVHAVTLEAASFPHRMEGRILPLDEAGKESRAYRQPLGVIGVISLAHGTSQCTCPTVRSAPHWRWEMRLLSSRRKIHPSQAASSLRRSMKRPDCPPVFSTSSSVPSRKSATHSRCIRFPV
jgi:Aldehyde dehydrogenase family